MLGGLPPPAVSWTPVTTPDEAEVPEALARPARALLEAIERAPALKDEDRDPIVRQLRAALEGLHAAARTLQSRPDALSPEALSVWSHRVREPLTAVTGWVHMLTLDLDEAKRVRGRQTIERNVRLLLERLATPPA